MKIAKSYREIGKEQKEIKIKVRKKKDFIEILSVIKEAGLLSSLVFSAEHRHKTIGKSYGIENMEINIVCFMDTQILIMDNKIS